MSLALADARDLAIALGARDADTLAVALISRYDGSVALAYDAICEEARRSANARALAPTRTDALAEQLRRPRGAR